MKYYFCFLLFSLFFSFIGISQNAATVDISNLSENSKEGCLIGNCKEGEGVYFYNLGYFSMQLASGTFSGGFTEGYASVYELRPYGLNNTIRVLNIKRGMIKHNYLSEGSFIGLSLRSGDTLKIAMGTFNDSYGKDIKLIKGMQTFYPLGKASDQYLTEEGYFENNDSFHVTVTIHGLITIPDKSFTISKYDPLYSYCISGNCNNGKGVLLSSRGIYTGKFKNNIFSSGTIEFFNSALNDGAGIFTTKDGVTGTFTPAGSEDVIMSYINNANDNKVKINYTSTGIKSDNISEFSRNWLTSVYIPDEYFYQRISNTLETLNRDAEEKKQAEYEKIHPYTKQPVKLYSKETDPFYYSPDQQRQRMQNGQSGRNSSGRSSAESSYSSFSLCSVCNGHGYTIYDCGQGGGHPCRKYCTACNGTGKTHN